MEKNRISAGKAADVAAANDLAIGNGNKVVVTGNGTINGIQTLNWQAGSEIDILCTGTPTFKHDTAASSGYARLKTAGSVDLVGAPDTTISFWYDGAYWQQKSSKIASARQGYFVARGSVTLVAGAGAVADANVTAGTVVRYWVFTPGGTQGFLSYANNAGVGFTINSTNAADTSVVQYEIVSY